MTQKKTYCPAPRMPGFEKSTRRTIEFEMVPASIQGLNFPCLECVLSTSQPAMGSLTASQMRPTRKRTPRKAGARPTTSVK